MRAHGWMLLVTALLVICACGGGGTDGAPGPQGAEPQAPEEAKEMTPADLGNQAGELYVQALSELADLMEARPPADELRPQVEALKESYVSRLVELGKKRESLDATGRSSFDSRLRMKINGVPSEVFTAYAEGQQHYQQAGARELAKLIGDFNILTQYANFELLKKQAPEEAERLGID